MSITSDTLVVQSFRRHDVPNWIDICLQSTRIWADTHSFAYRFVGDELFALVPEWYRLKARPHICILTDLARLELALSYLENGYRRVAWIDADVLITRPNDFLLSTQWPFGFSKEVWISLDNKGVTVTEERVNNSVCWFTNESHHFLKHLIDLCKSVVYELPSMRDHLEVGTRLLTTLHRQKPLLLIESVGLLSPTVIDALLCAKQDQIAQFVRAHDGPLCAFNLCNHFRTANGGSGVTDDQYSTVIKTLLLDDLY